MSSHSSSVSKGPAGQRLGIAFRGVMRDDEFGTPRHVLAGIRPDDADAVGSILAVSVAAAR